MLHIAGEREVEGDLIHSDAGQGLRFRPGVFDGAISISCLQWLCNADRKSHEPLKRLKVFFERLFLCLRKGARAVMQFYPETAGQVEMITSTAMRAGFGGGLVVDFPHSAKAKKHFLVVHAGLSGDAPQQIPKGLQAEDEQRETIANAQRDRAGGRRGKKASSY